MLIQCELDAIYRVNEPISSQSVTGHLRTPDFQGRGFLCHKILLYFHIPTWKNTKCWLCSVCFLLGFQNRNGKPCFDFFRKIFHIIFTPDFRRDLHQLGMDGHVVVPWWEEWPELGCVILIDMYLPQKILYICNVYPSYKMQRYIRVCTLNIVYIYIHVCHVYIGYRIEDSSGVFGTKNSRLLDP